MAYHIKNSLEDLIPLLEMSDIPWAIRDNEFINVFMNKAAIQYANIPAGLDISGLHDKEIPVDWSEFADQYEEQDSKVIDSGKSMSIIETSTWYGNNYLTPYVCEKNPVYLGDQIVGTVWNAVPFKLFTPLEYVDDKPGKFVSSNPPVDIFTSAELRVAFFLINKSTAKETAKRLNITHRTVQNHVTAIYQKAGVSSFEQFLEYSIQTGLDCYLPEEYICKGIKYI